MSTGTVDPAEIARFSALAESWWTPTGPFSPLHMLNPARLAWARDLLCTHFKRDPAPLRPFEGLSVVDIGCGGGLIAEPLARMGATVLGIDASDTAVKAAAIHAESMADEPPLALTYRCQTLDDLVQTAPESVDVLMAMEIVEHVADLPLFLSLCARVVKPGGLLLFSTVNRTVKSYALAIIMAEYVFGWLPRKTHTWSKFPKPSELAALLRPQGVEVIDAMGFVMDPLTQKFITNSHNLDVNYALAAHKA